MDSLAGKRMVIFGCGYLGGAVACGAVASGAKVTGLTRNPETAGRLRTEGIETVVADLAGDEWYEQIPGAPEFVLNCVGSGAGGAEGYRRSYVAGLSSIAAWARRHGAIGTMVYTSSTGVYPQADGERVDESSPVGGASERERLLLEAEAIVRCAEDAWRRWFVLRLAGIYGPGRHYLLNQVKAGAVTGTGGHRLNLIHRDDAVAAILACFGASEEIGGEVFNVADDAPARKEEVVAWLAERFGVPVPAFVGGASQQRAGAVPDRVIANAKLRARVGWQPRYPTFREGFGSLLSR